jgi:hypothetical protein
MEPVKTPKQRQREKEADHEQEHEYMKRHQNPRCLKWEAWRSSLRSKDKESLPCCQAIGREVRIIHHREGQYPRWHGTLAGPGGPRQQSAPHCPRSALISPDEKQISEKLFYLIIARLPSTAFLSHFAVHTSMHYEMGPVERPESV